MNTGKCTITIAEFWVFFIEMKLAVDLHIPYLEVESESSCVINLIRNTVAETHIGASLVRSIKELLTKPQKVVIRLQRGESMCRCCSQI
ncbi:hypothetical protein AHAS_Ahas13G0412200 [Arachis hypogaea]